MKFSLSSISAIVQLALASILAVENALPEAEGKTKLAVALNVAAAAGKVVETILPAAPIMAELMSDSVHALNVSGIFQHKKPLLSLASIIAAQPGPQSPAADLLPTTS